jgi:hypothetical protein
MMILLIILGIFAFIYYGVTVIMILEGRFDAKKEFWMALIPFQLVIKQFIDEYTKLK